MTHHEVNIDDASAFEDNPGGDAEPVRETYEVVNELIKRGETYAPGSTIDLDPETAARFIENGDVKETTK